MIIRLPDFKYLLCTFASVPCKCRCLALGGLPAKGTPAGKWLMLGSYATGIFDDYCFRNEEKQ